jgi:uncharacterized iron-regulated protein
MNVTIKLIMVLLVFLPSTALGANLHYALDVQINTEEKKITGTAWLKTDTNKKIGLSVRNLRNLKVEGTPVTTAADKRISVTCQSGKETMISYEALFVDEETNFIDKDNVFLTEEWYPRPDLLAEYALSVTLPKKFIATSAAEEITVLEHAETKTFDFQFKHPLDTLHVAASTRYVLKKDSYKNIAIETYFFKEDARLADTYIDHTKKYLKMYETMLTPYPYQRFAVVENIFPFGDSMPTSILLGSRVVHLPYTVKTSLGHGILHEWFGKSVYVDFAHGNWAEGITTYLADYHYAALQGKDRDYRKQIMIDYDAYVNWENAIPISNFRERHNKAQSAIGYGKTAMVFHSLRKRYGDKTFFAALRAFIRQNTFRKASWHDIQRGFEKVTGKKLYSFFINWLTRRDIPDLHAEDGGLRVANGRLELNLTLLQQIEAYPLHIPITLYTESSKSQRIVEMKDPKESISLILDEPPTKVVIDENYDLMRHLAPQEIPPVLDSIMGKEELTVVISPEQRATYQPLIDSIGVENLTYVIPEEIISAQIKENSLLIAGYTNTIVKMLFGKKATPEDGVRLKVYKNPYNVSERIMLLHAKNTDEVQAVERKISYYGKYTELAFNGGKNTYRTTAETDNGISVLTRPATRVIKPDKIATLDDILPKLMDSRVIYLGERHDRFAHHINQLQIIKKLYEAGHKLAVGMEMFEVTNQKTVDDYIAGRIEERTFLRKSGYFDRWGYDYNLYKPIIDYLKQNNIPLIALKIERDITRKVAREGIHSLTDEQARQLPSELDFSNEQYRTDLIEVYILHGEHHKYKDFNYFLQAQLLWDEGMAESAQQFLSNHPEYKMVILAGNDHVAHRYGIPERLYRRNPEPFTVIVQDKQIEVGIADYVLLTTKLKGNGSPRLGVKVEERDEGLVVLNVDHKSPAEKAGFQKGDILYEFAGEPIKSLADLKLVLFYSEVGSTLKIQIKRDDKILDKEIELF